ncbi:MAG TPA: hypothetical protein VFH88_01330 [Candidatus Krumholzibacteria bacterium]|nr:hypothetical protein [Candidatus Krumholzibacteria bacterium]
MRIAPSPAVHLCRRYWPLLLFVAMAAVLAACSSGDRTLEAVDPNAVAINPTYDQVHAIVHNNCEFCHKAGSTGRISPLSNCEEIVGLSGDILARIQDNTMPPSALPRLSSEDKLLIQRWVENGAPAPCN